MPLVYSCCCWRWWGVVMEVVVMDATVCAFRMRTTVHGWTMSLFMNVRLYVYTNGQRPNWYINVFIMPSYGLPIHNYMLSVCVRFSDPFLNSIFYYIGIYLFTEELFSFIPSWNLWAPVCVCWNGYCRQCPSFIIIRSYLYFWFIFSDMQISKKYCSYVRAARLG